MSARGPEAARSARLHQPSQQAGAKVNLASRREILLAVSFSVRLER
jgi:hypothetical protein